LGENYAVYGHNTFWCVADCNEGPPDERAANARLIAEAGTVTTETGLTPRQLAEQRAELLAALESVLFWWESSKPEFGGVSRGVYESAYTPMQAARSAIAKAEPK
jgi:hypothetical protein